MIDYDAIWWRSFALPLLSGLVWQFIRAIWLRLELGEPMLNGYFVQPKFSNKTDRNIVHARLGTLHCTVVLILSTTTMWQHRHETWEQWNFQRTTDLDDKFVINPFWPLWVSLGYFISDFFYISDFPAYYWHHIAAIIELAPLAADPNCSMVATEGLWVAEIGGLLLAVYLQFKSLSMYAVFIGCYAFSRFFLLPLFIYKMWWSAFQSQITASFPIAMMSNTMSLVLMLINWNFWWTHVKKFRMKWKESKKAATAGKDAGKEEEKKAALDKKVEKEETKPKGASRKKAE